RVGTDRPVAGSVAQLRFRHAIPGDRLDGGACLPGVVRRSVSGALIGTHALKRAGRLRTLLLRLKVAHGPLCGANLTLTGPKGQTYARGSAGIIRGAASIGVVVIPK